MATKKFLYVNRKAPHGTVYALESLEVVLIGAAFEQDVSLAFVDDGVYQLMQNQDTAIAFSLEPYAEFHLPYTDLFFYVPLAGFAESSSTDFAMGNIGIAIIYIVANVALAVHIFHGTYSLFQSLGINNPRTNGIRRPLAMGLAAIVLVGNLSFPIAVQAGLIDQDNCEAPCGLTAAEAEHGEE